MVQLFPPLCPRSLLKDAADPACSQIPTTSAHLKWGALGPTSVQVCVSSLGSGRQKHFCPTTGSLLQVLPLPDTPCLSFPIPGRGGDFFPDHHGVL